VSFDAFGSTFTEVAGVTNSGDIVGEFGDSGGKTRGFIRTEGTPAHR